MTRVNITVERLIVHGLQTFYPNNTYKVDKDVAEAFVLEGYATIVKDSSLEGLEELQGELDDSQPKKRTRKKAVQED